MAVKAVQLLINSALPPELQNRTRKLDAGGIGSLMLDIARQHPERYAELAKHVGDAGRIASWRQGESLHLADLKPVIDRAAILRQMDMEVAEAKKQAVNAEDFKDLRNSIWTKYSDQMEKMTMAAAMTQGNNLGYSVVSGARGKPLQLKGMLTTPGIFQDSDGKIIPLFVRHSFSEGLRPSEYLAGAYGARTSIISTKHATAKGGFFAKTMVQSAAPQVVTIKDCGVSNGIDLDIDDASLRNRVLSSPAAGYPAGTVIDKEVMGALQKKKVGNVIVRSALTCQAREGVCAKCLGVQADGKFPRIGDAVGITASQAIGEPITQMALNKKHTSGAATGRKEYSGFDVINRFAQSPEVFEDRAELSENDGMVETVEAAPQGGSYVTVSGNKHYIAPGYPILVKPGQQIEAGEQLADGLVDPRDIVRLKGIGSARRYYSERLKQILDDSGMTADKRNTEILARAALDHVRVTDVDGMPDALPDDVISYNSVANGYEPPGSTKRAKPSAHIDNFLQHPALHYSIGTRVTPSVAKHLESRGVMDVHASPDAPPFEPEMVRLQSAALNNPDWVAAQHASYLTKSLEDKATRGETSNIESNVHFVPRLAIGTDFGKNVRETGKF